MTYYTTDETGRITAFADFKFLADEIDPETGEILTPAPLLETDREIVRGRDNRLYFAEEEPEPTAAEQTAARRAEIQAELAEIDRANLPALYTIVNALAGDETALAVVTEKQAAHEAAAAGLRAELRELEDQQ